MQSFVVHRIAYYIAEFGTTVARQAFAVRVAFGGAEICSATQHHLAHRPSVHGIMSISTTISRVSDEYVWRPLEVYI